MDASERRASFSIDEDFSVEDPDKVISPTEELLKTDAIDIEIEKRLNANALKKQQDSSARWYIKILFSLIIGSFSCVMGEVFSGRNPAPFISIFYDPSSLITYPLYVTQMVFFSYLALRSTNGNVNLSTLYLAGILFGMYETFIVKTVWKTNPLFDDVMVYKTDIFGFMMWVLWFHPFFSFFSSLVLAELLLTDSKSWIFFTIPNSVVKALERRPPTVALSCVFAIWMGVYASYNVDPLSAFSSITSFIFPAVLIFIFRKLTSGKNYTILHLLPNIPGFFITVAALTIVYVTGIVTISPRSLPDFGPQIVMALTFLIFSILFFVNIRYCRTRLEILWEPSPSPFASTSASKKFSWIFLVLLSSIFVVFSVIFSKAKSFSLGVVYFSIPLGLLIGLFIILSSFGKAFRLCLPNPEPSHSVSLHHDLKDENF